MHPWRRVEETLRVLGEHAESPELEVEEAKPPPCLTFGQIMPQRGINLLKIHKTSVDGLLNIVIPWPTGKPLDPHNQ